MQDPAPNHFVVAFAQSLLVTPSSRLQCASVCKCACQVGTVRQKAASIRSCFAYMHCTACTKQLNTSHRTYYSRDSARLQDNISLVDLTCAAPPVQHHKMCTGIYAFIAIASKPSKTQSCCEAGGQTWANQEADCPIPQCCLHTPDCDAETASLQEADVPVILRQGTGQGRAQALPQTATCCVCYPPSHCCYNNPTSIMHKQPSLTLLPTFTLLLQLPQHHVQTALSNTAAHLHTAATTSRASCTNSSL
jgi:hypothetical protein